MTITILIYFLLFKGKAERSFHSDIFTRECKNISFIKILDFSKKLRGVGFHRTLTYDFKLKKEHKCATLDCDFHILDQFSNNFYIDPEYVQNKHLSYFASESAEIEQISSKASSSSYFVHFNNVLANNTTDVSIQLPYSFRYGDANLQGFEKYAFKENFVLASSCSCVPTFHKSECFKVAEEYLHNCSTGFTHLQLLEDDKPSLSFDLPVANTTYNELWSFSTLTLFFGGAFLLASHMLRPALSNAKAVLLQPISIRSL